MNRYSYSRALLHHESTGHVSATNFFPLHFAKGGATSAGSPNIGLIQFKRAGGYAVCVAFVRINFAEHYVSFEGRKSGLPTANVTNIQSRKQPKRGNDSMRRHAPPLMNSRSLIPCLERETHSLLRGQAATVTPR